MFQQNKASTDPAALGKCDRVPLGQVTTWMPLLMAKGLGNILPVHYPYYVFREVLI